MFENNLAESRTEAKNFIISENVFVNGKTITKPAYDVDENDVVSVNVESKRYVSRGGLKLEAAIEYFKVSPNNKLAIDVGASSGGFTDCLLKNGAEAVVAVDSGSGQMVRSLREDSRVIVIENYNARYMKSEDFPFVPNFAVMDVSFISATLILPALSSCLAPSSDFICLVKPQFEVGRSGLGKGGIVKNDKLRKQAVDKVVLFAKTVGFDCVGVMESPITGGDGNIEFLVHFKKEMLTYE